MNENQHFDDALIKAFHSTLLKIIRSDSITSNSTPENAFFYDSSSRRARVTLRVGIDFSSQNAWKSVLRSGILDDLVSDDFYASLSEKDEEIKRHIDKRHGRDVLSTLQFECDCNLMEDEQVSKNTEMVANNLTVEGVAIKSCQLSEEKVEGNQRGLIFHLEIIVRASHSQKLTSLDQTSHTHGTLSSLGLGKDLLNENNMDDMDESSEQEEKIAKMFSQPIYANLSIRAVFSMRHQVKEANGIITSRIPLSPRSAAPEFIGDISLGLLALENGATVIQTPTVTYPNASTSTQQFETKLIRSATQTIPLKVLNSITLTVREVGGASAATGATLVSLTVAHSNLHDQPVTINNIALHPGHSLQASPTYSTTVITSSVRSMNISSANISTNNDAADSPQLSFNRCMQGGENSIIDMSHHVRWGYAPGTAPTLPLVLSPHEAFSTVIKIDANDNLYSRTLVCPVAVVAEIGSDRLLVATDAKYTTSRVAEEISDAFRIDMSLREARYSVGAPLVVSLRVLNLSNEDRNLMLLMAKDEDKNQPRPPKSSYSYRSREPTSKQPSKKDLIVSEVNGYTFGVWGLAGDDDGTTRHNRDHELLAVDAALLLGEVKGQHSIEAELRFVPLKEGTLDVPNLKLYDKLSEKWYSCVHMLKIVASAS